MIAVAFLFTAMLIYPPFQFANVNTGAMYSQGYAFISSPPYSGAMVNIPLLAMQIAVVAIVGAIAWSVSGD